MWVVMEVEAHRVAGVWQRVLAAEMDGPRHRTIRVQLLGIG